MRYYKIVTAVFTFMVSFSLAEIYLIHHGAHFNEIVYLQNNTARTNVLLFLYRENTIDQYEKLTEEVKHALYPDSQYLLMLSHMFVSCKSEDYCDDNKNQKGNFDTKLHLWTEYSSELKLFDRFKCSSFDLCVVFIGNRSSSFTKIGDEENYVIISWIWNQLKREVIFTNTMDYDVGLFYTTNINDRNYSYELPPNSDVQLLDVPIGTIITATHLERIICAWKIKENVEIKFEYSFDYEKWKVDQQLTAWRNHEYLKAFLWSSLERHQRMLHQPSLLPRFTDTGYVKMSIPPNIHRHLTDRYRYSKHKLEGEYYPNYFTLWNLDEVNITQVSQLINLSHTGNCHNQWRQSLEKPGRDSKITRAAGNLKGGGTL